MRTAAWFLTVAAVLAQAPASARAPQGQLQNLVLTVVDSSGQYVPNLKQEDFIVEEDGVRQQPARFAHDSESPVSIGILIDKSDSMRLPVAIQGREKVPAALLAADGAARVVVRLMKEQDEFLFMTFDERFHIKQSFTTDKEKVSDLLYKNLTVGGGTHLYSAVGEGLKETRKKAKNRKRALVVITDVHDTSGDKIEEVQAIIREHEIPVYTFGMRWDAWGVPGEASEGGKSTYEEEVLKMMASDSGGNSMVVDIPDLLSDYTIERMIEFVQQIEVELRGQYTFSYTSTTPGSTAGKVIRVRAVNPDYQVKYRREALDKAAAAPAKK